MTEDSSTKGSSSQTNRPKTLSALEKQARGGVANTGHTPRPPGSLRAGKMSPPSLTLQGLSQGVAHSPWSVISGDE